MAATTAMEVTPAIEHRYGDICAGPGGTSLIKASNSATHDDEHSEVDVQFTDWQTPEVAVHPAAAEIVRQVEFYFGDDNLRQDAHLLGLIKEGNGSVSLNEVLGFKKMRRFKPKSAVKKAIKQQSTLLEVTADGKRIERKTAPVKSMRVKPKINRDRQKKTVPADQPWMTPGMLKPTGFEPYVTNGPLTPAEEEQNRKDYATDVTFTSRIETAIARFSASRKMHQETRTIFSRFMIFGGMEGGQNMFTGGGLSTEERENLTKKEIAELTADFVVSERVMDGFDTGYDKRSDTWIVDFEAVTKGYLSSQFLTQHNWYSDAHIQTASNVLQNFFNYLMHRGVCPEYHQQLLAAREVCVVAEQELPKLAVVDQSLPGDFNIVCSTLFGGNYAGLHSGSAEWNVDEKEVGWSTADAKKIFLTAVAAWGTEEQLATVETRIASSLPYEVISSAEIGLEVVSIEYMTAEAAQIYTDPRLNNTIVKPLGRLHCVRWDPPQAAPMDLPKSVLKDRLLKKAEQFVFLLEGEILKSCYPGLKMEVCVKELDIGFKWIDHHQTSYASFFVWLQNENIRDWKEPGPPREWMGRQPGGTATEVAEEGGEKDADYSDEEPD